MHVCGQSMTIDFLYQLSNEIRKLDLYQLRGGANMEVSQNMEHFRHLVDPALKSKQEEFVLFGYDHVTEEDIWAFLMKKKWKKVKQELRIAEIVQSILSINIGEMMNYKTVEALKSAEFSLSEEDRLELLK